ncbi:MAG: hypothetical protein NDF55_07260 [archaeon GB-1867-005]|nr:hypothetical protein [Candidatus Culexmicrobium cathedralense]
MLSISGANVRVMQKYSKIARYWGRKIYEATKVIFLNITGNIEGKVILDPFGGAGCIVLEALRYGARTIYIDINPYAYLIARVMLDWFDYEKLRLKAEKVLSRKKIIYQGLDGSTKYIGADELYTIEVQGVKKRVKYYEWIDDECCAVTFDGEKIRTSDFTEGEPYYQPPKYKLWYPWGEPFDKKRNYDWLHEFFTNRNLIILTNIWHDIRPPKTISGKDTREHRAMTLIFLSILYMASKMARRGAGSWGVNSYWVPRIHVEYNPYDLLRRKLKRILKMSPPLQYQAKTSGSIHSIPRVIRGKLHAAILHGDCTKILKHISPNSIDYVVTDPPHADEVQYLELSFFMNAWLRSNPYSWAIDEVIVNRRKHKDFNTYIRMLTSAYKLIHNVLKPRGKMILIYHEESEQKLKEMIKAAEKAGFSLEKKLSGEMKYQRNIGDRNTLRGKIYWILVYSKN